MPLFERLSSMVTGVFADNTDKEKAKLHKQASMSYGYMEHRLSHALVAFLKAKDKENPQVSVKPGSHAFNQFWLQLPKLQEGFKTLEDLLEDHTGSREGPLPVGDLVKHAEKFGLQEDNALLVQLCTEAPQHRCLELDHVGVAMMMLIIHLSDSNQVAGLDPHVRLLLCCLETAFSHFQSARTGRLDKREVTDALQHESAKAHAKEGKAGHTSHRLANKLFEGLEWSHDNTVSFERFLRGVVRLLKDEFDPDEDPDPLLEDFKASRGNSMTLPKAATGTGMARMPSLGRVSGSGGSATGLKSCLRKSESGGNRGTPSGDQ